ncbi:hypothetical protein K1719_020864 [Acacia pycnantha]|nr:hypothetical protein K1719_020864 [Acacia pycnantha]
MNSLTGKIPSQIGSLYKLERFAIHNNNLTGKLPSSLWNLSSLPNLDMAYNHLEGSIPEEIGLLKNLKILSAVSNHFSGALPHSLFNMSSLIIISVTNNQLNMTRLPDNMFTTLPNLIFVVMGLNQISGPIPSSITNASSLRGFDITSDSFVGQVPSLGALKDLRLLNLEENNLGSNSSNDLDFITSLQNCSKLESLSLVSNNFGGVLPNSIGNLSTQLIRIYLGNNQIHGTIPESLGTYTNLITLTLDMNKFSGTIPSSLGNLYQIQLLALSVNQLSGEIPISIGNLSKLVTLDFSENRLEGKIPPIFANMNYLLHLDLGKNNFHGSIPKQIFGLSSLSILLNLSHNSLDGSLPSEVGTLQHLSSLDISKNHLSGEIPSTIGECTSMEYLNLRGNSFNGSMPSSLASLISLAYLDISSNNLSGPIVIGLQNISFLEYLNVSFNMLDGEVSTKGVFSNASAISVTGNSKLCGGISELHLPPCAIKANKQKRHHNLKLMAIMIGLAFFLIVIFILSFYWRKKRSRKLSLTVPTMEKLSKVSYRNLHIATEGFSANNLIGFGSFGSVYKGRLGSEDDVVAIKVLNLQKKGAHKSFISECNALKNIRHRNLIKTITCCSSMDYKGQEFKALVFEYMSNGSLEKWLHPDQDSIDWRSILNLRQRFHIIYEVASALYYLHHECEQPIVHCDLKPSNVLLDDDMVAHVSDFGLARLISTINGTSFKQTSTSGIKGTIGYAPPEYGISFEVSTQGDVYSFGIFVLEMLTGRRPTEEMFKDGNNLHSYIKSAYPNNLLEIVDSTVLPQQIQQTRATENEIVMENLTLWHPYGEKSILSLFEIGLACSAESPKERLNMMDVMRELSQIRSALEQSK